MPIIGIVVAKLSPDKYTSHTSFLIQETAKMNPFLQDIAVSTMLKDRISALSTLLKSRHILTSVAEEMQLIKPDMSNSQKEYIIKKLSNDLSISTLSKDFIKITLKSDDPTKMKDLLTTISNHFIEQLLAPERSSIEDSSEFLSFHIDKRRIELEKAESQLAKFRNNNAYLSPEIQNQVFIRLATLKQSLAEKISTVSGMEKNIGSLSEQLSRTNPVIGKIEEKIIDIRSQLTLLQAKYTQNHSQVLAKKKRT